LFINLFTTIPSSKCLLASRKAMTFPTCHPDIKLCFVLIKLLVKRNNNAKKEEESHLSWHHGQTP
jgi:hypothetical protein